MTVSDSAGFTGCLFDLVLTDGARVPIVPVAKRGRNVQQVLKSSVKSYMYYFTWSVPRVGVFRVAVRGRGPVCGPRGEPHLRVRGRAAGAELPGGGGQLRAGRAGPVPGGQHLPAHPRRLHLRLPARPPGQHPSHWLQKVITALQGEHCQENVVLSDARFPGQHSWLGVELHSAVRYNTHISLQVCRPECGPHANRNFHGNRGK